MPLACAAIAACTPSTRPVDEIPPIDDGPIQSDSSWWIPINAWSYDLPCASPDDPAPNLDIDGDGDADGFALGPPITDERGTTTQAVCIGPQAHLIVDGLSVGTCPWPGGRNRVLAYYADADCNGEIDDDDGDGRPDALGRTVVISMDGPMPPINGVSNGEVIEIDGEIIPITADNYGELVDSRGVPIDTDQDGLVDTNAYYYDGEQVTMRYFEIDPRTGAINERPDLREVFAPTNPADVPVGRSAGLFAIANVAVATLALPPAMMGGITLPRQASSANVAFDTHTLPPGMIARTTEQLAGSGSSHTIAAELEGGLPSGITAMQDGFRYHFVALRSSGSIKLTIDEATRSARGWQRVQPTVFLDGERLADVSREAQGVLVVETGFTGDHAMTLELRFPSAQGQQ